MFVILIMPMTQRSDIFVVIKEMGVGEPTSPHAAAVPASAHLEFPLQERKLGKLMYKPDRQMYPVSQCAVGNDHQ